MMNQPPSYLSYLLRLWQSGRRDKMVWRASLENPMTGDRRGFASLKELFAFLETQAEQVETQIKNDDPPEERRIGDE
jgi:hypothetical protein